MTAASKPALARHPLGHNQASPPTVENCTDSAPLCVSWTPVYGLGIQWNCSSITPFYHGGDDGGGEREVVVDASGAPDLGPLCDLGVSGRLVALETYVPKGRCRVKDPPERASDLYSFRPVALETGHVTALQSVPAILTLS